MNPLKVFLLCGLIAVGYSASLSSPDVVVVYGDNKLDDLIHASEELHKFGDEAVSKLEKEGKHLLAVGLKFLIDQMDKAEKQLVEKSKNADDGTKFGIEIAESLLKTAQDLLRDAIKRINEDGLEVFDGDDDAEKVKQLKEKAAELRKKVDQAKGSLKKEDAEALEMVEEQIESIAAHIDTVKGPERKLVELLLEALEKMVDDFLKNPPSELVFYDDELEKQIKAVEELKKFGKDAVAKLEKTGRHILALGLQGLIDQMEKAAQNLVEKSKNAKNDAERFGIKIAESLLQTAEDILRDAIKRVEGGDDNSEVPNELINRMKSVDELKKFGEETIKKLEKEGKHLLAMGLQALVAQMDKAAQQLVEKSKHAKNDAEKFGIEIAESLLDTAEDILKDAIKRAEESENENNGVIGNLAEDAERLRKFGMDTIEKLEKEGKHLLAMGLQRLVDQIEKAEQTLANKKAKNDAEKFGIKIAEGLLKLFESLLETTIRLIGATPLPMDANISVEDLQKEADRLNEEVNKQVAELRKEGKQDVADGLEAMVEQVKFLAYKLGQIKGEDQMSEFEKTMTASLLAGMEQLLNEELKKLHEDDEFYSDNKLDDLIHASEELKKFGDEAISKLESEGKHILAMGLKFLIDQMDKAEQQLVEKSKNADDGTKFGIEIAESLLKTAQDLLRDAIKRINEDGLQMVAEQDDAEKVKQLKEKAKQLREKVDQVKGNLKKEEVDELENNVHIIDELIKHLETDTGPARGFDLMVLEDIVQKLEEELKNLPPSVEFYDDNKLDDLIHSAEELKKFGEEAVEKLEKEGKHLLAMGLKFLVEQVEKAEQQLVEKKAKNDGEKFGIEIAESLLKTLEDLLKDAIKRANGDDH